MAKNSVKEPVEGIALGGFQHLVALEPSRHPDAWDDSQCLVQSFYRPKINCAPETVFTPHFIEQAGRAMKDAALRPKLVYTYDEGVKKVYGAKLSEDGFSFDAQEALTVRLHCHPDDDDHEITASEVESGTASIGASVSFNDANRFGVADEELEDTLSAIRHFVMQQDPTLKPGKNGYPKFEEVLTSARLLAQRAVFGLKNAGEGIMRMSPDKTPAKAFAPKINYLTMSDAKRKNIGAENCTLHFTVEGPNEAGLFNIANLYEFFDNGENMLSPELSTALAQVQYCREQLKAKSAYGS